MSLGGLEEGKEKLTGNTDAEKEGGKPRLSLFPSSHTR